MSSSIATEKIFLVAGTRPEYIKLAPVYKALKNEALKVSWVSSSQHEELLSGLLEFFGIKEDFNLLNFDAAEPCPNFNEAISKLSLAKKLEDIFSKDIELKNLATRIYKQSLNLFIEKKPSMVIVQGDTMTAFQVALAAKVLDIPVAHIEAGLRTADLMSPYPEEISRRMISELAAINFAPSKKAEENLLAEKIDKNSIHVIGNTVIDALSFAVYKIESGDHTWSFDEQETISALNNPKKKILITAHRRENFETLAPELIKALEKLISKKDDLEFYISVHKNPNAQEIFKTLKEKAQTEKLSNLHFLDNPSYPLFVKLMKEAYLILTDSGGIQEEAPYLQKPLLVLRKETERPEVLEAAVAKLAGLEAEEIYENISALLVDKNLYEFMIDKDFKAYGDGRSALAISNQLKQ